MSNSETPGRTLSSLTPEECQTLFALAFGYAPPLDKLYVFTGFGPVTIGFPTGAPHGSQCHSLIVYPDGQALANKEIGQAVAFNFRKVAGYLDSLNIYMPQP